MDWKEQLVQRAYNINSVQQAANILRKCILYPEPTNVHDPTYYLLVDFQKPDALSNVNVPIYPIVGDNLKVQEVRREIWYCKVTAVDEGNESATVRYYQQTPVQGVRNLSDHLHNLHFESIISLTRARRAQGPRIFRVVDL